MAKSGAFSIEGRLFVGLDAAITDTDGTGGVELRNIEERGITIIPGGRRVVEHINQHRDVYSDWPEETVIVLNLREVNATAMRIQYPEFTSDGVNFGPGRGAVRPGERMPGFPLLIVPSGAPDPATVVDEYFYAPKVRLHEDAQAFFNYHPELLWTDGNQLVLVVSHDEDPADDGDTPEPWTMGPAATLATEHGLGA